jgi:hypothetical protein
MIVIARRFRGPVDSGNGGYTTGLIGSLIGSEAEVTLRAPPPLDTPLDLEQDEQGALVMREGDRLIAEGRAAELELEVEEAVDYEEAARAEKDYAWRDVRQHPYPECFVCGPARPAGDGLAIHPGPIEGRRIVASTWIPDPTLAAADSDLARPEFVWAALDCPTWHGVHTFRRAELAGRGALLGRLTARIEAAPRIGERCVVIGWELGLEGRKVFGGSAVFGADGRRLGAAKGTWILTK